MNFQNANVESFKKLKPNQKITIVIENWFGELTYQKVTYLGDIKQHGYIISSGVWGLYGQEENGDKPCYTVLIRPYNKRKVYRLKIGFDIIQFKEGWD